MINTGEIVMTLSAADGGEVIVIVRYDPASGDLRDWGGDPCLTVVNSTDRRTRIAYLDANGEELVSIRVNRQGYTRTAAQLAALGYTHRSQVTGSIAFDA